MLQMGWFLAFCMSSLGFNFAVNWVSSFYSYRLYLKKQPLSLSHTHTHTHTHTDTHTHTHTHQHHLCFYFREETNCIYSVYQNIFVDILIFRRVSGSCILNTYSVWNAILGMWYVTNKWHQDYFPRWKKEHT